MPFTLVGIGELLWDVKGESARPGGAPANFAVHAAQLGASAFVASRIGDDDPGRDLLALLTARGVNTSAIQIDPTDPTGRVTVVGEPPTYTIHEHVAWDRIAIEPAAEQVISSADAVCFGTLAQRSKPSRGTIPSLLKHTYAGSLRVLDVNRREPFFSRKVVEASFALADVVKLNDEELRHLSGWFGLPAGEVAGLTELVRRFGWRAAACTRGERGSVLVVGEEVSEQPGIPVTVIDTVGAGDAFTAAMTLGLLSGWPAEVVHERAAAVAAFVCTQPGGMPELPAELRAGFVTPPRPRH
ncbi:MAG: carbohydrate kinase [Fimbriiglobus sp.]|jgi:fructokinase|nr:carbohydrate kinase [Fimbriiglobus sp.]